MRSTGALIGSVRGVAAFALAGAVVAGAVLGWIPALSAVNVHAIGAATGGALGYVASAKHLI